MNRSNLRPKRFRALLLSIGVATCLQTGEAQSVQVETSTEPHPEKETDLGQEVKELRRELNELKQSLSRGTDPEEGGRASRDPKSASTPEKLTPVWERDTLDPGPLRDVYDKPFLLSLWRKAYIGGYFELEYHGFENDFRGIPRGFRLHRTNLFAFAEISDNIRFASEFEFEYEEPGEDVEINVEMAFVDWEIAQEFKIRGGALLVPLGRTNLNHDGPTRVFTERPLVSTFVIPTTLTDPGIGIHGLIAAGRNTSIEYETYVTNGFDLLDDQGNLAAPITEKEQLLREGRPSNGGDNNKSVSTTGRLGLTTKQVTEGGAVSSAFETGVSWHVGNYDERNRNLLAIVALDMTYLKGPFTLTGEAARAGFERDSFSKTSGIPDDYYGYSVQASWDFLPETLKKAAPHVFAREGAGFTLATRYDWINLDSDRVSGMDVGINFHPFSDTVFKFSYRFGWLEFADQNLPAHKDSDQSGFSFSVTSYF